MAASVGITDADRKQILDSLTEDDLKILQEAFTVYDKNHDGTITTKVLGRVPNKNKYLCFMTIVKIGI